MKGGKRKKKRKPRQIGWSAGEPTNPKLSDEALLRAAQAAATRARNRGTIIGS